MTAKCRVEFIRTSSAFERGVSSNKPAELYAVQTIDSIAATPVLSNAAPSFNVNGKGFARITVLNGAVNVATGASPTASETGGFRLEQGQTEMFGLNAGHFVSLVEAQDGPAATLSTYTLASNQALAANATTTQVSNLRGGLYIWQAAFTGTATLTISCLAPDNSTWIDLASVTATGVFNGDLKVAPGATIRLKASAAITSLYSTLGATR